MVQRRPLQKQEKVESVEYDIRLEYPNSSKVPKLFTEIESGYRDGFNARFDFPPGVEKAVIIYVEEPFGLRHPYALARYVYP